MNCPTGQVLVDIGADTPMCMSPIDFQNYAASAAQTGAQPPRIVNQTLSTLESDFGVSGTTLTVIVAVLGLFLVMSMTKK